MPRFSQWVVCAALSIVLVYSQTPSKSPAPTLKTPAAVQASLPPSIGVFMDFDSEPGSAPLAVMEKEVQKLIEPAGLSLNWQLVGENRGRRPFASLVVLKFKGQCRAGGWSPGPVVYGPASAGETTLGFTDVVNGRVVPFSEVECDRIRDAVSYLDPAAGRQERQIAFGLALARVVAHELYHVLAHTTVHATSGLAKASETLEDLATRPRMPFDPHDSRAMRKGFTGTAGQ